MAASPHRLRLLSWYLEGELPLAERRVMERHLTTCPFCWQELSLLRQTIDALDELPIEKPPADLRRKIIRRIKRELRMRNRNTQKSTCW